MQQHSKSQTILGKFNQTLREFVEDIQVIVNRKDKDVNKLEASLDVLTYNARFYIKMFSENALTDHNLINLFEGNNDFFLNQNYDHYTNNNENYIKLMTKIKQMFISLNEANRKKVYDYFKLLTYYALKDIGKDVKTEIDRIKNQDTHK
jgi:hypothetical protein